MLLRGTCLDLWVDSGDEHLCPCSSLRADYGVEQSVPLAGLSEEQICGKLKELADMGKSQAVQ